MTVASRTPAEATFVDYYRCALDRRALGAVAAGTQEGYFLFHGSRCYGRPAGAEPSPEVTDPLADVSAAWQSSPEGLRLPFDLAEVVTNLREERYRDNGDAILTRIASASVTEDLYYLLRPMMPVGFRRHLQQLRLRGWQGIPFPQWPVDFTVDDVMRTTMGLLLKATGAARLPFIWFWPEGAPSCTMLTHDVEGERGLDFCTTLLELDARFGFRSAYQLIPEGPCNVWPYAAEIRRRGCEVNLHDLNHDGRLYRDREQFLERARRINEHAREHGCRGFRSGAMYRQQAWYSAFDFDYDMSVPNAAHLEPQRGGCCTVMPYFVGDILELPLTTVQDYSLFFILGDYSTNLWREQITAIRERNGLISLITHPDYLTAENERGVYEQLLALLAEQRDRGETWAALPGDVNEWWRQRQAMTLTHSGESWQITGAGSERARIAYASLDGDTVVYSVGRAA